MSITSFIKIPFADPVLYQDLTIRRILLLRPNMKRVCIYITAAVAAWFIVRIFKPDIIIQCMAVIFSMIAVHITERKFFFDPFTFLSRIHISKDDPIMKRARERAIQTLPELKSLFQNNKERTMVKFVFKTEQQTKEKLWANVLEFTDDKVQIFVRTPSLSSKDEIDRNMEIHVKDIVDWQIEMNDGSIRGGFTNIALFKIFEKREGYLHPELAKQLSRHKDAL